MMTRLLTPLAALGLILFASAAGAQNGAQRLPAPETSRRAAISAAEEPTLQIVKPHVGAGYVAYPYPVIGSCPCESDRCFHPGRYDYGGKAYRESWFRRWARAHHGLDSMLSGYPCPCIYPTSGRPYAASPAPPDED